jgi:hypothetical protein
MIIFNIACCERKRRSDVHSNENVSTGREKNSNLILAFAFNQNVCCARKRSIKDIFENRLEKKIGEKRRKNFSVENSKQHKLWSW